MLPPPKLSALPHYGATARLAQAVTARSVYFVYALAAQPALRAESWVGTHGVLNISLGTPP